MLGTVFQTVFVRVRIIVSRTLIIAGDKKVLGLMSNVLVIGVCGRIRARWCLLPITVVLIFLSISEVANMHYEHSVCNFLHMVIIFLIIFHGNL